MSNDDKASYKGGPIIAVAVVLLLPVAYVGAYFGLSEFYGDFYPLRVFNANWQIGFFKPALMIEKRVRGGDLSVNFGDEGEGSFNQEVP